MAKQKQPTGSNQERAEQLLIEKYFNGSEIEDAKTAADPVEFLRKLGVESRRGMGGGKGIFFETMTGGRVEIFVASDEWNKTEPTLVMPLTKLAQKVVEKFKQPFVEPDVSLPNPLVAIDIARLIPSSMKTQELRRKSFTAEGLDTLGDSILKHGLQQSLLVRPAKAGKFEIIFGERRFLAAKRKGINQINCVVADKTNAEVMELQYEENHRRQENNPLIDALSFKLLKEEEGYTNEQLADRFSTSAANVVNKLILNELIPAAKVELENGSLPLKHAYFLARFPPDTQALICREQYAYKYHDRAEKAAGYQSFVEDVEENITHRLAAAPFSITDERLHIKGLICPDCTMRTGYAPALFADLTKDDACLNRACFEIKTNTHLRLKREEIALHRPNPDGVSLGEAAREVPLVTSRDWTDKTPFAEKPLLKQEFLDEPECASSELSLIVEGSRKGQQTYICRDASCEVHHPPQVVSAAEAEKQAAALERKIEQLTREKVLAASLDFFTDYKPIWMFDDLVRRLILELWEGIGYDTRKTILRLIKNWKNLPKDDQDREQVKEFIASLDKTRQSQLIFLLIFKTEGYFQNAPQDGIKQLAADYARQDYLLFRATARVELAAPEDMELAQDILTVTKSGLRDIRPPDFDLGDAAH